MSNNFIYIDKSSAANSNFIANMRKIESASGYIFTRDGKKTNLMGKIENRLKRGGFGDDKRGWRRGRGKPE